MDAGLDFVPRGGVPLIAATGFRGRLGDEHRLPPRKGTLDQLRRERGMEFGFLGFKDRDDIGEPFAAFGLDGLPGGDRGIELGLAGIAASLAGGDLLVGQTMFNRIPVEANLFGTIGTDETANALLVDDDDMVHNAHTALGANPATRREVGNEIVIRRRIVFR